MSRGELTPLDLGGGRDRSLLRRALVELERVHRAELARLLREAARAGLGVPGEPLETLREAFAEALDCAEADGLELPAEVLAEVRAWLAGRDVPPCELAAASLRLEGAFEGRRLMALALLAGGVPR